MKVLRTLSWMLAAIMCFAALPEWESGTAYANPGMIYYVAVNGDDSNDGSFEAPFATLEKARDAIRALKSSGGLPDGGVVVYVRGGIYERTQTFELNAQDSGTAAAPIVYTSYPGERTRISGGIRLDPSVFSPVTDAAILNRLPAAGRGHVLQADLAALGITDYGTTKANGFARSIDPMQMELFINGKPMTLARWPNSGFVQIDSVISQGSVPAYNDFSNNGGIFAYPSDEDNPDRWTTADQAMIHGVFRYGYADDILHIDISKNDDGYTNGVNPGANRIKLKEPHHYGLVMYTALPAVNRFYALNLLEEIDMPGEYFIDRNTGMLYLYPEGPLEGTEITLSMLDDPLIALEDVSYVEISRFYFENGRGMGLYMEGGSHNKIAGNTFRNLGTVGISVGKGAVGPNKDTQPFAATPAPRAVGYLHDYWYRHTAWDREGGTGHIIQSNNVINTGHGGILIGGGNRKTLTPSNILVTNNRISNYSRWGIAMRPGLLLSGVGITASHNEISDSPSNAIIIYGNDHLIEKNEIHHVLLEHFDAGGIYMGRNPSENGNVIKHNYFHELGSFRRHRHASGIFG